MRLLMLKTITLFILLMVTLGTLAQSRKHKKANEAYAAGEYLKAIEYYEKSYAKEKTRKTKAEISFFLAESYWKINEAKSAAKWYKRAVRGKYSDTKSVLFLAHSLKKTGKYEDAIEQYENYKLLVPDDKRADQGIESCNLAMEWTAKPTRYKVERFSQINSSESDFSPFYFKGSTDLIFTSSRQSANGDKLNSASGQLYTDLFKTSKDRKGKWSEPVSLSAKINTEKDEGAASLNADFDEIYFTGCYSQENSQTSCAIYKSTRTGTEWGSPERLQLVTDSTVSFGHPAISPDGLNMVFVADMKNGFGQKDLWIVSRLSKSGNWGVPKNLGDEINTVENEMYPYIQNDTIMFFSSEGHVGMGGLDIFKATKRDNHWVVENMKYPINSNEDDFGIVFHPTENEGFFSSSRGRSDDIYSFNMPPLKFSIKGVVKNEKNDIVLAGAEIKLTGSNGTTLETKSGNDGTFSFKIKQNTDYLLISSKKHFLKGKAEETTKGLKEDMELEVTIYMAPNDMVIELPNILYDFGSAKLRPESMVSLDKLIETLNLNPNITIELGSHTDFRGEELDNQELSQRRAKSVVDYLVKNGIVEERLTAKGYGESVPNTINERIAPKYNFLNVGDVLTEEFINALNTDQKKETAHQINRRTEFKVLRTDYNINAIPFGGGGQKEDKTNEENKDNK